MPDQDTQGRVLVTEDWIDFDLARSELRDAGVAVDRCGELSGDDVVALLISIGTDVGARQLERLPGLRIVATCSAGYDHVDVRALSEAGIWVTHGADYCSEEVADHTIAFVLGLLRCTHELDRDVRAGRWDVGAFPPRRIAGSTLGIVGCGRIGSRVARRASSLGMRVLAVDPNVGADAMRAAGAEKVDELADLLRASHVVSVHTWLDPSTERLIGREELAVMGPGAYLVNAARAGIVDHDALGEALRSGHLAGAALDVLPIEPPPAGTDELDWPCTVLNPHSAWYSDAAEREIFRRPARDIARVLAGDEPLYPVARPAR